VSSCPYSCFEVPQKIPQRAIHAEFHDGALKRRAGPGNYDHPHRCYSQIRFQVWVFKLRCTVTKLCALKPLSGTSERRGDIDAAVKRMNADAVDAEKKLENLNQAGTQSWSALMAALTETGAAFDRANEAAREAFKRAA
jgi:hypothetical protein